MTPDLQHRFLLFATHAFALVLVANFALRAMRAERQRIYRFALIAFIAGAIAEEAVRIL